MHLELHIASLEKKKKKENDDFRFFKIRFLGSYKAELESEDIFILRRVRAFHRYPDIELSFDVLSPLPIVLS